RPMTPRNGGSGRGSTFIAGWSLAPGDWLAGRGHAPSGGRPPQTNAVIAMRASGGRPRAPLLAHNTPPPLTRLDAANSGGRVRGVPRTYAMRSVEVRQLDQRPMREGGATPHSANECVAEALLQ